MTQQDMMKLTSGARPNTQIVIKGGTVKRVTDAETLKQQGNSYFTSLEYEKAIDCYTKCLERCTPKDTELKKIVFSNRAQAYLKTKHYKEAERDANEALQLDV